MIIASAPRKSGDVVGRAIAAQLNQRLGRPAVVENRAGVNQVIGSEFVAKVAPDGYTMMVITGGGYAISLHSVRECIPRKWQKTKKYLDLFQEKAEQLRTLR